MNKRKLFFAIGVIAVILLGSTFFALNQRGKEEKKEKKIGYLTASWEQNYTSMDELVKGSDLIAHVRMLDDGKKVQGKSNTIQYRAKVENALYGCEKNDIILIQMTGRREENKIWEIKEDPLMNQREEYVMFLQLVKKNTYITLTATQGRFWYDTHTKTVSSMNYIDKNIKDFCAVNVKNISWNTWKQKVQSSLPEEKRLPKAVMHASWHKNYTTIKQLKVASDLIGVVQVKEKVYDRIDKIPITKTTVVVKRVVKGCKIAQEKEIIMTGGIYNGHYYEIEDAPLLEKEQEYLIFAQKNNDGTYSILSGAQGRMLYNSQAKQIISTDVAEKWDMKGISYQGISLDHEPYDKIFEK